MNVFSELIEKLKNRYREEPNLAFRSARPLNRSGFWTCSFVFDDDFLVSIAWNRHSGFMLTTGYDVSFGSSYDEVYEDAEAACERIISLVRDREATNFRDPVALSELRKLHGVSQAALADRLRMTKGGLSQLEGEPDLLGMKVGTIKKLVDSLGGSLVLTAKFPNGEERELSIS